MKGGTSAAKNVLGEASSYKTLVSTNRGLNMWGKEKLLFPSVFMLRPKRNAAEFPVVCNVLFRDLQKF